MSDRRELSPADRSEYASQGFLHIRGAFSQAEVDLGLDIVDRALRAHASVNPDPMPYHPSYFDEGQVGRISSGCAMLSPSTAHWLIFSTIRSWSQR